MNDSIVMFRSYYEAAKNLDDDIKIKFYQYLFEYCFNDIIPEPNGIAYSMFILMKPNVDSSIKKFNASKKNGRKGGRPKTQEKPNNNPDKTQEEPKPNLNKDKDKDKDKDKNLDKNKEIVYTADFETFYSLYPNPFNKQQTFKNWKTCLKEDTAENIFLATNKYIKMLNEKGTERQFIKNSTNFIGREKVYKAYLEIEMQPEERKSTYSNGTLKFR
jgi:hypothetical protein